MIKRYLQFGPQSLMFEITAPCTECLHFVALQMALYVVFDILLNISFVTPCTCATTWCIKTNFFYLYKVSNFNNLHRDTTTTLIKIKVSPYLIFAMYKWSQTSEIQIIQKKQPDTYCCIFCGKTNLEDFYLDRCHVFNTKSMT